MTEQAQRIAIAKWMGWQPVDDGMTGREPHISDVQYNSIGNRVLPAFTRDLNAMHEAEAKLPREKWSDWAMTIRRIIHSQCNKPECYVPDTYRAQLISDFWFYHATAAQRAEALLRTLNLWTENAKPNT